MIVFSVPVFAAWLGGGGIDSVLPTGYDITQFYWDNIYDFWDNIYDFRDNIYDFWDNIYDFWDNIYDLFCFMMDRLMVCKKLFGSIQDEFKIKKLKFWILNVKHPASSSLFGSGF